MKRNYVLFFPLLLLFFNCKKEIIEPYTPTNYLANFQTEKPQIFDLDTIEFKEIIGKHGTKINFDRYLFDVEEGEKIQLELIELYDFKEILYRNIQTLTTDDELLETSGVLKITFTSNEREVKLKNQENIEILTPKGKLKGNSIFLSEKDSLGNIKWNITDQNYIFYDVHIGGGITKRISIPRDSLPAYKKRDKDFLKQQKENIEFKTTLSQSFFILNQNNKKWINIDKLVLIDDKLDVSFKNNNSKINGYNIYVVYEKLDAFLTYQRDASDLNFKGIPVSGKTSLIFIGGDSESKEVYYDKILINSSKHNSTIKLNPKKIKKEKLKALFD